MGVVNQRNVCKRMWKGIDQSRANKNASRMRRRVRALLRACSLMLASSSSSGSRSAPTVEGETVEIHGLLHPKSMSEIREAEKNKRANWVEHTTKEEREREERSSPALLSLSIVSLCVVVHRGIPTRGEC